MQFLYFIFGIKAGVILVLLILWLKNRKKKQAQKEELEALLKKCETYNVEKNIAEEKNRNFTSQLSGLDAEVSKERAANVDLNRKLAAAESDLKNLAEKLQDQKKEMENLQEKFNDSFKILANEILEEKTKKFTEQNSTKLNEILKPLNEKIKEFEKKVEETYDKESKQRFSLQEEVKRLAELNQKISLEAHNLTNALKGQAKTQGNWGEIILESILEKSGLVKDREYYVQASFTSDEGKRLQPDVVVHYPGERYIVIDAKVSLVAYERYASAESDTERDTAFKEHILSIKNHVNELNGKNYQGLYQLKSLDFVMMFLPIEPAYLLAIQKDPELWNYAYQKRILLISPTNLIAALKMIATLWQQENQNKNALDIAEQSGALYDKFVALVEDLIDVGKKLEATQTGYKNAMNKLNEGKGNLVKRAEDIRKMGAKTKKALPQSLVDRAVEE